MQPEDLSEKSVNILKTVETEQLFKEGKIIWKYGPRCLSSVFYEVVKSKLVLHASFTMNLYEVTL